MGISRKGWGKKRSFGAGMSGTPQRSCPKIMDIQEGELKRKAPTNEKEDLSPDYTPKVLVCAYG